MLTGRGSGAVSLAFQNDEKEVAVLQLSNPKRRNALSGKMMVELADCILEAANTSSLKLVVVKGTFFVV